MHIRFSLLLLAAVPLVATNAHGHGLDAESPRRQFDFWLGEWSVLNRHLQPGGVWVEGSTTKARYTPVVAGSAVLEEWVGPFPNPDGRMVGFSLRAWNPALAQWEIALLWTSNGQGNFGSGAMRGGFRHGRGEFFTSLAGQFRTRFTFSDALPDTVRWDSATTEDGGDSWSTSWIMEFTRTRAGEGMTQDGFFESQWSPGLLSEDPLARELDGLVGTWEGVRTLADGTELEARLRAKLVSQGCLVVDLLETRATGTEDWDERLFVRGLVSPARSWEGWVVSESEPVLSRWFRAPSEFGLAFESSPTDGISKREVLQLLEEDWIVLEEETRNRTDGTTTLVATTELQRSN